MDYFREALRKAMEKESSLQILSSSEGLNRLLCIVDMIKHHIEVREKMESYVIKQ